MSYKLNEKHSTRVEDQNFTSSPIWRKAYTELIHAPSSNTSNSAKLPLTKRPWPAFLHIPEQLRSTKEREKNVQVDLRQLVRNLIWTCISRCQPQELLPERNCSETNGSPGLIQHKISRLQAAASSDEPFREACRRVRCRSRSRHFLCSSNG